jgi:hypothetical protein
MESMCYLLFTICCFCLLAKYCSADDGFSIIPIDVNSPNAVKNAEFAVSELAKLSDSDIYTTLTLNKILYAAEQDGIFHFNTLLTLALSSPHFKSGKAVEEYKMIVLDHKEDGVKALAIDEFPVMDTDAIEQFYIRKVERRRVQREESFRKLEMESRLFDVEGSDQGTLDINNVKMKENLEGKTVGEVLAALDSDGHREQRRKASEEGIQQRLEPQQLEEEQQLLRYSLGELFDVITGKLPASDFQIYRANTLLDAAMSSLPR